VSSLLQPVILPISRLLFGLIAVAISHGASVCRAEGPTATPPPKGSSETQRNRRLSDQLAITDKQTESSWLGSGSQTFLALYLPDHSGKTFANALILHDNLQHPDWPGTVHSLRTGLADAGWNTLSMAVPDYQPIMVIPARKSDKPLTEENLDTEATELADMMPSLSELPDPESSVNEEPAAKAEDVPKTLAQRVQESATFMAGKNPQPLVIIAIGSSATLATKQTQDFLLQDINGLVIIDPAPLPQLKGFDENLDAMDLRIPVLDIVPEFNARSDFTLRKRNAQRMQQSFYQQRVIKGTSQDFSGADNALLKAIRGWGEAHLKNQ
jgi:hypothetical protein